MQVTLDNMLGRGLDKAGTSKEEMARYFAKIRRRIADSKNSSNSLDSRFDLAFEALLQTAVAALRANGYRTTSEAGHQRVAIQLLPKSIGIDPAEIRTLDEYRKKRSIGLYEADFDPSEDEVKAVTLSVEHLLDNLVAWIRNNKPELVETSAAAKVTAKQRTKSERRE